MSVQRSHTALLIDLKQKVDVLKKTIQQIEITKKAISKNVLETKSNINTLVSRQLESLRNREVWLLEQVDLIQSTKQDLLNQQVDGIWHTLGQLDSCLECVKGLQFSAKSLEYKDAQSIYLAVAECLNKFDQIELLPTECPNISLKANPEALKGEIQKFGSINITQPRLSMDRAFAAPGSGATSLPQPFEDYEDEEHQVLYKTIEEIRQRKGDVPTVVNFCAPKPKLNPDDWLLIPTDIKTEPVSTTEPLYPPFQVDLDQWLAKRNLSSSTSIHQWLRDLQGQAHLEDDEGSYDGVSPTEDQSDAVSLNKVDVEMTNLEQSDEGSPFTFPYFVEVQSTDANKWLLGSDTARTMKESTSAYQHDTMKYFREISNNTKDWLQKYEEKKKDEDKDVCCQGSCSPKRSPEVDIENIASTFTCLQNPTQLYFQKINQSDTSSWLQNVSSKGTEVAEVCRANEPCSAFSDCMFDQNCCQYTSSKPGNSITDKNGKDGLNSWLSRKGKEMMDAQEAAVFPVFSAVSGESDNNWLKYDCQHSGRVPVISSEAFSTSSDSGVQSFHNSSDWLKDDNQATNRMSSGYRSDGKSGMKPTFHTSGNLDQWLYNGSNLKSHNPTENESWLLCSSTPNKYHQSDVTMQEFAPFKEKTTRPDLWLVQGGSDYTTFQANLEIKENASSKKVEELPEYKDDVWLQNDVKDIKMWLKEVDIEDKGSKENMNADQDLYPCFTQQKLSLGEWLLQQKLK